MGGGNRGRAVATSCAVIAVIAALAGCGTSVSSSSLTTSEQRFIAQVDGYCSRANAAATSMAVVVGGHDPIATINQQLALVTTQTRQLTALHAPPDLAASYRTMLANMLRATADFRRVRAALIARDATAAGTADAATVAAAQQGDLQAYEAGYVACATEVEPSHFIAGSARERLAAELDQICAPLVADYVNLGIQGKALALEVQAHRVRRADASRLVAELVTALGRDGALASSELRRLPLSPADRRRSASFIELLPRLSARIGVDLVEAEHHQTTQAAVTANLKPLARQVGLAAIPTGAGECVAL